MNLKKPVVVVGVILGISTIALGVSIGFGGNNGSTVEESGVQSKVGHLTTLQVKEPKKIEPTTLEFSKSGGTKNSEIEDAVVSLGESKSETSKEIPVERNESSDVPQESYIGESAPEVIALPEPETKLTEDTGEKFALYDGRNETVASQVIPDMEDMVALGDFLTTAYDLGIPSCGKPMDHPQYGKSASGYDLAGKSREQAMTVAVDPSIIPLGSKLYIEFPAPYTHFNGVYKALDVGGGINGAHIDLFMGDFQKEESDQRTLDFGKKTTKVYMVI